MGDGSKVTLGRRLVTFGVETIREFDWNGYKICDYFQNFDDMEGKSKIYSLQKE